MEFTHKYEKTYTTPEEFQLRFNNFRNNLIDFAAMDNFTGEHSAVNKFSDMTFKEFKATYLNLKAPADQYCVGSFADVAGAPDSFDWRTKGMVSPVKNQGSCGSCWAFSIVGYLEAQALIQGKKELYSEQQVVDCDTINEGCNGGWPQVALQYLAGAGIQSESSYTYKAVDQTCKFDKTKVIAHTSDVHCVENPTVSQLQSQVATTGPLSIVLDANDFFTYSSGILSCHHNTEMNHAVLLVGYTQDSWIIKNSWGANWGEKGFIRISNVAGKNCAVGSYITFSKLN
jgi:C1A family cysteine protease